MTLSKVWKYYLNKDVQEALLESSKNREVVGVYESGNFDRRPNTLTYADDIIEMVKKGVVSFHGSVERWSNPMSLETGMTTSQMNKLRIGWDLIIDPDCPDFEISKITTKVICHSLEDHGIKNYSIKFTGGKGFHIGLPFEIMPKKINEREIENGYPDVPRIIIDYLKNYVKEDLKEKLLELDNPVKLAERVGKNLDDCLDEDGLDPLKIVEIDRMVASPRHMFRLPYSLHEKSLLVSLPLTLERLDDFRKEDAEPSKIQVNESFLAIKTQVKEATGLVIEALDWSQKMGIEERDEYRGPKRMVNEIPKKYFPPCILKMLGGLPDGRKRALFVLTTFLQNMGWSWEKIEKEIEEWNERNQKQLPKNYIKTQLKWHKRQPKTLLPPNCDNDNYYKNIVGDVKDECCNNLKNPVTYAMRKFKMEEKSTPKSITRKTKRSYSKPKS
ncbi:MAG: hypothetical protein QXY45_03045 [Candidatus Aenigmatarchaeota archaeon]